MAKILIIRFSALGDVAMTIPVISSFAVKYPEHEITVLSNKNFRTLFENVSHNIKFIGADLKEEHSGLKGLFRLFRTLKESRFDYVADFHSVLRSHVLRILFKITGHKTALVHKGRYDKRKLTSVKNKVLKPLKSTFVRYYETLERLGFSFELKFDSIFESGSGDLSQILDKTGEKGDKLWLGIAPFAKHLGKIYPFHLQKKVMEHFANDERVKVFIFGGGVLESQIVLDLIKKFPTITSLVGKMNMNQELILMSHLDAMFSMDSANMHFASLVGTPVVSVWGATHPYAGFLGWNQTEDSVVQANMECRPCSVFGDKPCYRGDYACLSQIHPDDIIQKIEEKLAGV